MWFFQWLKLAVDMEGQTLEFGKLSNWSDGTTTTRKGRYDEKQKQVTVQKRTKDTKTFKVAVNGHGLSAINMNELKMGIESVALAYEEIEDPQIFDWDLVPSLKE